MSASTIHVRDARNEDAERLVLLHYAAVHESAKHDYPQNVLDAWSPPPEDARFAWMRGRIDSADSHVLVAQEQNGSINGFCMFSAANGVIHALYVSPERSGNGIGRQLLQRVEALVATHGNGQISLNASKNAVRFYRSQGYTVIRPATQKLANGEAMDCYEMLKRPLASADTAVESPPLHGPYEP
jgi:ribosomal protein S18 acetylase RimI-like enzyme